jgi:hypothetical protein
LPSQKVNIKSVNVYAEMNVVGTETTFLISVLEGHGISLPGDPPPWEGGFTHDGSFLYITTLDPAPPSGTLPYVLELSKGDFQWSLGTCRLSAYIPEEDTYLNLELKSNSAVEIRKIDEFQAYPPVNVHRVWTVTMKTAAFEGYFGDVELTQATMPNGDPYPIPAAIRHRIGYYEWSAL